jgi:hypothetical protein
MASPVANNIRKEAALKGINPTLRLLAAHLGIELEGELGRFSKDEGVNQAMQLEWLDAMLKRLANALLESEVTWQARIDQLETRIVELEEPVTVTVTAIGDKPFTVSSEKGGKK